MAKSPKAKKQIARLSKRKQQVQEFSDGWENPSTGLTAKQRKYCEVYAETGNHLDASKAVGWSGKTGQRQGHVITRSLPGQEYIGWLRERALEAAVGTEVQIIEKLRGIALAKTRNAMEQQTALAAMKILLDRYYPREKQEKALDDTKQVALEVNKVDEALDQRVKKHLNTYTMEKGEYKQVDSAKG